MATRSSAPAPIVFAHPSITRDDLLLPVQVVPVAAYRAAVKVLNGPGCCLAGLDLAREARTKLGDSAEASYKKKKWKREKETESFFIKKNEKKWGLRS